jgi:hypothetical protein
VAELIETEGAGHVQPSSSRSGTAHALPAPNAQRLRKPSWRDPRLAVGIGLVLVSVVLGSRVVAAADDTEPVWAAARTLTPGDPIGADDVVVVDVRLPDGASRYWSAGSEVPDDLVALRTVGAGELLPRSGVGAVADVDVRPVGIPVDGTLPAGLGKGSRVDVWVAQPDPDRAGGFTEPERLVDAAEVAEVSEGGGALGSGGVTTVQVLVTEDQLPLALGALANGAAVSVVLLPGGPTAP